jgi:hypothetical protein
MVDMEPLNASNRCDTRACGAQAFFRVSLPSGSSLTFCWHHFHKNEPALLVAGAIVDDYSEVIQPPKPKLLSTT